MGYSRVYAEYMVPLLGDTEEQLDFYNAIYWRRLAVPEPVGDTIICPAPLPGSVKQPVFSYWQTGNSVKLSKFDCFRSETPSKFALGNRLPDLQNIVEITLGVQTDDAVHGLFESGGDILQ